MMIEYPAEIMVKVLFREFPEIAQKVLQKVKEHIPENTLTDYSMVEGLLNEICRLNGITIDCLRNEEKSWKNSNQRRISVIVLLKLYQPEILSNLVKSGINVSLINQLRSILNLSKKTIYQDFRIGKQHYQVYKDFRNSVQHIYSTLIKNNYGKENSKAL